MKERLLQFISYLNIPVSQFQKTVGLSGSYINNFKGNMSAEKADAIFTHFPELNKDWLLYGRGEMLKETGDTIISAGDVVNKNYGKVMIDHIAAGSKQQTAVSELRNQIAVLQQQIEELRSDKRNLQTTIDSQRKMIEHLMD